MVHLVEEFVITLLDANIKLIDWPVVLVDDVDAFSAEERIHSHVVFHRKTFTIDARSKKNGLFKLALYLGRSGR